MSSARQRNRGKIVRTIGSVQARFKIIGYNIRRLVQLERMPAAPA
jgi:hypothetical protein